MCNVMLICPSGPWNLVWRAGGPSSGLLVHVKHWIPGWWLLHDNDNGESFKCLLCIYIYIYMGYTIFTQGQFWPSGIVVACVCLSVCVSVCVCVRQPRACPRHKSRRVQARTTKFGQKVQNNLVKVPIVLGGDWPWPSRSNLTWKAKFTPFWACPRHNS